MTLLTQKTNKENRKIFKKKERNSTCRTLLNYRRLHHAKTRFQFVIGFRQAKHLLISALDIAERNQRDKGT